MTAQKLAGDSVNHTCVPKKSIYSQIINQFRFHILSFLFIFTGFPIWGNFVDRLTLTNQKSLSMKLFWMTLSELKYIGCTGKQVDIIHLSNMIRHITVYFYLRFLFFVPWNDICVAEEYICSKTVVTKTETTHENVSNMHQK